LVVYPWSPSVWFTLAPEIFARTAYGIMQGMASTFISMIVDASFNGGTAKAFALFVASYALGFALGYLAGGLSLHHISMMKLYYITATIVFISGFGTLHQRNLL
jgi:predicted MFS family arabinose efflux permease